MTTVMMGGSARSVRSGCASYGRSPSRSQFPLICDGAPVSPHRKHTRSVVPQVNHAKTYFNSGRNQVYARFSCNDWSASNAAHYKLAESERSKANRLRADVFQSVRTADNKTRHRQSQATKKLHQRVENIDYWRDELDQEIRAMEKEQESLKEHLRVLHLSLSHTSRPLSIAEDCLRHREQRVGIDQVKDQVEVNLEREVQAIKKCQHKMQKLIDRGSVQTKLNHAAQQDCERDLKDKNHAHSIDDRMYLLKNSSSGLAYHNGIELVDNTISIPDSWVKFTQENLARSQKCRAQSESLRSDIDMTLRMCANQMWSQFNDVNNALGSRLQEVTDARNKLQSHLQRTLQEVFDCEKTIELLRKAIMDKEAPLKVAETRMSERTKRLNVELCNDPVMKTLQKEIIEIRNSIRQLKENKRSAEITLNRLYNTKNMLERDIHVKENSIEIDQKNCLGMRKAFPMESKMGPIFNMPLTY